MANLTKPDKPGIAFFAAQFFALLVGPNNVFKTIGDLCKFAAQECGITGISLHTGALDVRRMIHDKAHREEVAAEFAAYGTPIIRLESHVVGQRVCMHPAVACRFVGFAPKYAQHLDCSGLEEQAEREMLEAIELSRLLNLRSHQTFPGGKTNPVAMDPWNAHPPRIREKALAIVALKWERILSRAGASDIRIGFEGRHIMEDLQNWRDFRDVRDTFLLDPNAKKALKWGIDVSHHEIEGDNPTEDVGKCMALDLDEPGHAKQGDFDRQKPGAHRRAVNMPWIERAGQFRTFGIANPQNSFLYAKVLLAAHKRSENGVHGVLEGECMALRQCDFGHFK